MLSSAELHGRRLPCMHSAAEKQTFMVLVRDALDKLDCMHCGAALVQACLLQVAPTSGVVAVTLADHVRDLRKDRPHSSVTA